MANETIITTYFQLHYPWLEKPQPPRKESDVPKYGFRMAFPQDEQLPDHIGTESCAVENIYEALDKVCMEEWDCTFDEAPELRGIAFPPEFKDGNLDLKKDDKGNRLRGQPNEQSAGKWLLGAKNAERIGLADFTGGLELDPKEAYAGCWCRAELEISAYDIGEKNDRASILVIKALNLQKCFDDERIGGGGAPQKSATEAFAGKKVANSNCSQTGFGGKSRPSRPGSASDEPVYLMTPDAGDYTREDYLADPDWTDELLISEGLMVIEQPKAKSSPARPGAKSAPARPGAKSAPSRPGAKSSPARPGAPKKPVYVMTAEAGEYTREDYLADPDWTDELLISEGLMVIEGEAADASEYMKPKPKRPGMPK